MAKSSIAIHPRAEARIMDIWSYTYDRWGEEQADHYIKNMHEHMLLVDKTYLWHAVPHADFLDVYFTRYEHHFIFFRKFDDDSIGILTVLHESMDIPARLFDDI